MTSTSITDAIDTMVRVQDDLDAVEYQNSGSSEHLDLITSATLLYTLITEMYGPEYFTNGEALFIDNFANNLNILIQEIYS